MDYIDIENTFLDLGMRPLGLMEFELLEDGFKIKAVVKGDRIYIISDKNGIVKTQRFIINKFIEDDIILAVELLTELVTPVLDGNDKHLGNGLLFIGNDRLN